MKLILFSLLLGVFILSTISPAQGSGIIGLSLSNVMLYVAGLILISTEMLGRGLSGKKYTGVGLAIVIAMAVAFSSIYAQYLGVYAGTPLDHFRLAKGMVFEPVLLYVMAFLLIDSREQGERYLLLLVSVLGVLNITSVIGAHLGIELYYVTEHYVVEDESMRRLTGFTGNPNKTAYLICILATFQYYFFRFHKRKFVKALMAFILIGELIVILLSGSRGGLLALVIVILFMSYRLKDMKVVYVTVLLAPVLIGVLVITESSLLGSSFDRIGSLISGDTTEVTSSRNLIWSALLSDYRESTFGMLVGNGFGASKFMGLGASPHSMYLMVLVEFGVIGLGIFLYFIFSIFRRVQSARLNRHDDLKISVLASGCVVVIAWIFTTLSGVLDLVWFTIGVSMATLFSASNTTHTKQQRFSGTHAIEKRPTSL